MTQTSRPQAENIANFPTGDSGPYSGDNWAKLFEVIFTGDQQATQGPLVRYLNELAVTDDGTLVTVDTGAGFCYGHWLDNSAAVVFNPSNVAREDRVVMVENNTNAAYGLNLEFPTVLTDYNLTASVEPWSCRLAILTGTGPGAPRPLVAAGGIFMVQLAHYDIDGAGAITGLTDDRDFCYFSSTVGTRQFLVPPLCGYDHTGLADLVNIPNPLDGTCCIEMLDTKIVSAYGHSVVPRDFLSGLTVTSVLIPLGTGDIYAVLEIRYGACNEDFDIHSEIGAYAAIAVVNGDRQNCILPVTPTTPVPAIGDIIHLEFRRKGDDVLDTIDQPCQFLGWLIDYRAKS